MAPEVMQCLVGRLPPFQTAILHGYVRHPVLGFCFPGIIIGSSSSSSVSGLLYTDLTEYELEMMDWFEDVEYTRTNVQVTTLSKNTDDDNDDSNNSIDPKASSTPPPQQTVETQVYVWTNPLQELNTKTTWDYERFRRHYLSDYLVHTVEPSRLEFERARKNQQPPK